MKKIILSIMVIGVSLSCAQAQETNKTSNEMNNQEQKEKQKEELILNNPESYQAKGGIINVPEFTTKEEKEAWFAKNNSLSPNQIVPNGDVIIHPNKKADARQHVIFADDPSFPVYTQTGNQQVDDQNYDQKKQDWINQNQAKYNSKVQPASTPISKEARLKSDENLNK
jgi:hypothetical protein|tara:strand:- start:196 stop:702 length:507 start_codon:yes stop_codon:yes gene_type:complete